MAAASARGDILVASMDADAVLRFTDAGAPLGVFASHPSLDGAASIAYGPDGRLYVLGEFSHNLLRFDGATGAFIDTFISSAAMEAVGLGDPGFVEFGPDGDLYLLHHLSLAPDAVWRFNGATGAFVSTFAAGSGVAHTHGLAFGPDGSLFLGNLGDNTIERYDAAGVLIDTIGPDPEGGLAATSSLRFGPDGKLYLTNTLPGGVRLVDPALEASAEFTPGGATWGILIDGGTLYAGFIGESAIRMYDLATATYLGDFVAPGGVPTPFDIERLTVIPEPATGLAIAALSAAAMVRRRRAPFSA
jgi:WD40 repeat protein